MILSADGDRHQTEDHDQVSPATLSRRSRLLGALLAILSVFTWVWMLSCTDARKEPWRALVARIASTSDPDSTTVVVLFDDDLFKYVRSRLAKRFKVVPFRHPAVPLSDAFLPLQVGRMYREASAATADRPEVWVVGRRTGSTGRKHAARFADMAAFMNRRRVLRDSLDTFQGTLELSRWVDQPGGVAQRVAMLRGQAWADSVLAARGPQAPANSADVPHVLPPPPTGPQLGKSDSLMNAVSPRISEWISMWRAALPGFEADSMWRAGRERWLPASPEHFERIPEHRDGGNDVSFEILGVRSPDGRYILDVDQGMLITPSGDSLEYGGEPESRTALLDLRAKTETEVDFCGTMCGFHWGTWLSSNSFALAYWRDADNYGQWQQGWLTIYSLSDSTATSYQTRSVPTEDALRYRTAWARWILRRYRTLKAAHPGT